MVLGRWRFHTDANPNTYSNSDTYPNAYPDSIGQHHWRDLLILGQPGHLFDRSSQRHLRRRLQDLQSFFVHG